MSWQQEFVAISVNTPGIGGTHAALPSHTQDPSILVATHCGGGGGGFLQTLADNSSGTSGF